MMKIENAGVKLFTSAEEEIIEKIVKEDHAFRKLNKAIDFESIVFPYRKLYSDMGAEGIISRKLFPFSLIKQTLSDFTRVHRARKDQKENKSDEKQQNITKKLTKLS